MIFWSQDNVGMEDKAREILPVHSYALSVLESCIQLEQLLATRGLLAMWHTGQRDLHYHKDAAL